MHRPGLYYPYIHVRDEAWLKVAALYWPSIHRLVPHRYPKRDSATARALHDASILRDESPHGLLSGSDRQLLRALRENAEALKRDYSLERALADWDGTDWSESSEYEPPQRHLAWIHMSKISQLDLEPLTELGLATVGRLSHQGIEDSWVGVHPALAGAYMTAVATDISQRRHYYPLTDQADLNRATPNLDVTAALNLLVGHQPDVARANQAPGMERFVMLAMQYAIPKDLSALSAEKVTQCRDELREELIAFRDYVKSQRAELTELVNIEGEDRRLEAFTEHVNRTIEVPLRKLERGLRLHKVDPVRALMLTGSVVPPAALVPILHQAGAGPLVTSATATLTAVGNAWWQVRNVRSAARSASLVGYLLDVRDRLTPATLPSKVRQLFLGTAGRQP